MCQLHECRLECFVVSFHMSCVMRKPDFCLGENKGADRIAKLIPAFVFTSWIVQFLYFLKTKFQASSHLLWMYSLVCVRPGGKPRRLVFSHHGSYCFLLVLKTRYIMYLIFDVFCKLVWYKTDEMLCQKRYKVFNPFRNWPRSLRGIAVV